MKKIPLSNYIKVFLIILLVGLIVFILKNNYMNNQNFENNIPIIRNSINKEINSQEIYNYIRENENAIIYIGVSSNKKCRDLETNLNTYIIDNDAKDKITYLNITKDKKKNAFIKEFNKFYGTNIKGYPSFVVFYEGKVKDILTDKSGLDTKETLEFLNKYISSEYYD